MPLFSLGYNSLQSSSSLRQLLVGPPLCVGQLLVHFRTSCPNSETEVAETPMPPEAAMKLFVFSPV